MVGAMYQDVDSIIPDNAPVLAMVYIIGDHYIYTHSYNSPKYTHQALTEIPHFIIARLLILWFRL